MMMCFPEKETENPHKEGAMRLVKFFTFLTFFQINSCFSQVDENILLVNVGELDYAGIAKEIAVVNSFGPRVIAIDMAFDGGDDENDQTLITELRKSKTLVMASVLHSFGKDYYNKEIISAVLASSLIFFPTHAKSGFVSAKGENGRIQTKKFITNQQDDFGKNIVYHFSVQTAMCFDSLKAVDFVTKNTKIVDVDYANGKRKFKTFSSADFHTGRVTRKDIEGKIVMFGFLGPGNLDKVFTPLNKNPKEPDMYGIEYLAHIVAQVLYSK